MPSVDELLKEIEGEDYKEKLDALAAKCESQLGMSSNEVYEFYAKEAEGLKAKMPPGTDDKIINRQAWVRTKGHYKADLLSTAEHFTGLIIGVGDKFDMVGRVRREAFEMWKEDRQKAISEGYCDADGNPLDKRETFASSGKENPQHGKPLPEHSYIRNLRGVCKKKDGDLKRFTMPLSDERTDIEIPIMIPVSYRANIRDEKDEEFELNQWSRIQFSKLETKDPDLENVESILADKFKPYLSDCGGLADYHARVQGDYQRFVLLNVDVDYVAPNPNPTTGNQMMIVSDDTLPDDHPGITVWIPPHLLPLDFDAGSRAIVGGSSNQNVFQGEDRLMVNAQSLFVDPAYRVAPAVQG